MFLNILYSFTNNIRQKCALEQEYEAKIRKLNVHFTETICRHRGI